MQPKHPIMWVLRITALVLCFLSIQKAWAGVWTYHGQQALETGDLKAAEAHFLKAQQIEFRNDSLDYLLGITHWKQAVRDSDPNQLKHAYEVFKRFTSKAPFHGKSLVYRGLSHLKQIQSDPTRFHESWDEVKLTFLNAMHSNPTNLWVLHMGSKALLSHKDHLSEQEEKFALAQIKKSMGGDVGLDQGVMNEEPTSFLRPGIDFLWQKFRSVQLLEDMLPRSRAAYHELLKFLEGASLWKSYATFYPTYLELTEKEYNFLCDQGDEFLLSDRPALAYRAYRQAFWIQNWHFMRAQAGILIAEYKLDQFYDGEHSLLKADVQTVLKNILRQRDEGLGILKSELQGPISQLADPEIQALYDEYLGSDKTQLDLSLATTKMSSKKWWAGEERTNVLTNQKKLTMELYLKPGTSEIIVFAQATQAGQFVKVALNGRPQGGAFVDKRSWVPISIQIDTRGGARWLQVSLTSASLNSNDNPIQLGPVQVKSQ